MNRIVRNTCTNIITTAINTNTTNDVITIDVSL